MLSVFSNVIGFNANNTSKIQVGFSVWKNFLSILYIVVRLKILVF